MSARIGFRTAQQALRQTTHRTLRQTQRRAQSTVSDAAQALPKEESSFSKFFNSPVGPKTVHFWAPIMKWGLVLAGAADFFRPPSQLSLSQNAALTATGFIWTRWCLIIKPRNVFLASVNFCLGLVGITQVTRVLLYQRSIAGVEEAVKQEGRALEQVIKDPKAIKEAVERPSK